MCRASQGRSSGPLVWLLYTLRRRTPLRESSPLVEKGDSRDQAECEEGARLCVLDEKEVKEQARMDH